MKPIGLLLVSLPPISEKDLKIWYSFSFFVLLSHVSLRLAVFIRPARRPKKENELWKTYVQLLTDTPGDPGQLGGSLFRTARRFDDGKRKTSDLRNRDISMVEAWAGLDIGTICSWILELGLPHSHPTAGRTQKNRSHNEAGTPVARSGGRGELDGCGERGEKEELGRKRTIPGPPKRGVNGCPFTSTGLLDTPE